MEEKKKTEEVKDEGLRKMVELNGKMISYEKFLEEQEKAIRNRGMKIVEVSAGVFKTRIQG